MSTKTRIPADRAVRMLSARRTAYLAYAAGATGILANLLLIGFFALQVTRPDDGFSLANDIVGSLAAAFMIPVALSLGGRLPQRLAARFTQAAGDSYCRGCRGGSWWCSASAYLSGCRAGSVSRCGSCFWADTSGLSDHTRGDHAQKPERCGTCYAQKTIFR